MQFYQTLFLTGVLALGICASAQAGPKVVLSTSQGDITIELNEEKAPATVKNFLAYVKDGFYDNTVFHRVIEDFMIQGGGFALLEDGKIKQKETKAPIQNEAKNGLKNDRGTIAMARTGDPHSATAQFFINHKDNSNLDYPSFDGWGYAVFGKVVEGMDVIDKIAAVETGKKVLTTKSGDAPMGDVPSETIVIKSVKVAE
jgi:peptidyl-prolyl cis-trans isomerase A (cyclophilin A)